jgi:hypothetical protein
MRWLQSEAHLYVFLAAIHLGVDMTIGPDGSIESIVMSASPASTNVEAVAQFFDMRSRVAPCFEKDQAGPSAPKRTEPGSKTIPAGRPCWPEQKILKDVTLKFVLPELEVPEAIQKRTVPVDKEKLVGPVRRYLDSRHGLCGHAGAVIPFYSDMDPRVYVLLEPGGDCPRGVATFSRGSGGQWEFGKFFVDVQKEQMSGVIARIGANPAIRLTL